MEFNDTPKTAPNGNRDIIKVCPGCGTAFTLHDLIQHPEIVPLGMQFEDGGFFLNVFYFNHDRAGCGSTFVVPAKAFLPLITEPVPESNLAGTEACGNHCLSVGDLSGCNAPCRYAPFRRFLLRILKRTVG